MRKKENINEKEYKTPVSVFDAIRAEGECAEFENNSRSNSNTGSKSGKKADKVFHNSLHLLF